MTPTDIAEGWSLAVRRLVVTAERLFALHGLDGVSLRQIAVEAGMSNHSAVHYHFKSKEGLVQAILGHRLPRLIRERRMLTRRWDGVDVRSRLESQYLPIFELAEASDNRYVTFVEQLQRRQPNGDYFTGLPSELQVSNDEFYYDLGPLLPHLDASSRILRTADIQALCLHAAVDRESTIDAGAQTVAFDFFVASLLDGAVGYLMAPAAASTKRLLRGNDRRLARRLNLL